MTVDYWDLFIYLSNIMAESRRGRPAKSIDDNAIREGIRDGKSISTISREIGVSQNTIRRHISQTQGGIYYRNFRDMERNISGK